MAKDIDPMATPDYRISDGTAYRLQELKADKHWLSIQQLALRFNNQEARIEEALNREVGFKS